MDINAAVLLKNISLGIVFVASFIIRLFPFLKNNDFIIKAFDPYMQVRSAQYILENGLYDFLLWIDKMSWYPYGRPVGTTMYLGVPLVTLLIYFTLNSIGIYITVEIAAFFVPALFGTFSVIYMYYVGKEMFNERVGVLSALLFFTLPSAVSRTVAGFVDNESIGVLLLVMTIYYFTRAMKRESIPSAIAAGLSLGLLTGSWGAFRYPLDMLALYVVLMIFIRRNSSKLILNYSITVGLSFLIGMLVPRVGAEFIISTEGAIALFALVILIIASLIQNLLRELPEKQFKEAMVLIVSILTIVTLIGIISLAYMGYFEIIKDKFISVVLPTQRNELPLINSVSEHLPLSWGSLFFNLNILVFFIPLGFYFIFKKPSDESWLLFTWAFTSLYFSASMVRLALILAPPAVILSALTIDTILYPYAMIYHEKISFSRRKVKLSNIVNKESAFFTYLAVGILLVIVLVSGLYFANNRFAGFELTPTLYGNESHDWQEAFAWLRAHSRVDPNTNKPVIVLSWWDYGYHITSMGNVTTLVDNATTNSTQIGIVATMLMWNESASVRLMKRYHVKYVLVHSAGGVLGLGSDLGKAIWMIRISEKYTPQFGIKEADYWDKTQGKYKEKFFNSVLWRLSAYDNAINIDPNSIIKDGKDYLDFQLTYFKEVFRSKGVYGTSGGQTIDPYTYPIVRIYEVLYPEGIEADMIPLTGTNSTNTP